MDIVTYNIPKNGKLGARINSKFYTLSELIKLKNRTKLQIKVMQTLKRLRSVKDIDVEYEEVKPCAMCNNDCQNVCFNS